MIISLLLMFIVADGCVFAPLAGAERGCSHKIDGAPHVRTGEGKRSRSQSLSVVTIRDLQNKYRCFSE